MPAPLDGPPEVVAEMRRLMADTNAMMAAGVMVPPEMKQWWEPRRENEQTPDYLGRVLDELGAPEMAGRARLGHFDDFHAPDDVADGFELIRLVAELRLLARERTELAHRVTVIENAVRRGEFDATKAESDRWAASKGGQETFGELLRSAGERRPPSPGRNDPCPCGSGRKWKRCHGA